MLHNTDIAVDNNIWCDKGMNGRQLCRADHGPSLRTNCTTLRFSGGLHASIFAPRALLGGLLMAAAASARDIDAASYGYPLTNPFEATIATTPPDQRPTLPSDDEINQDDYSLTLRPEREFTLPDNFWSVKKLRYRLASRTTRRR
jgi:hypothetical protein